MKNVTNIYSNRKEIKDIKPNLTEEEIEILNSIEFNSSLIFLKHIRIYYDYKLGFDLLLKNYPKIEALGKNGTSLESYKLRYGDVEGESRYENKIASAFTTTEQYENRYGKEEAARILSSRGSSEENYITRHGVEKGHNYGKHIIRRDPIHINLGEVHIKNIL